MPINNDDVLSGVGRSLRYDGNEVSADGSIRDQWGTIRELAES